MQKSAVFFGLAFLSLLQACPAAVAPHKQKTPTPKPNALRVLMKHTGEQFSQAGPIASETSSFVTAAREIANDMKTTRDLYAPDPGFYQLADEALAFATESVTQREPGLRAIAWTNTQRACQDCHLRYGGPKTEPAK